jgi:hypothetical protein
MNYKQLFATIIVVAQFLFVGAFGTLAVANAQEVPLAPVLTTDQADYLPGQTATVSGANFTPFETFLLKVFGYGEDGVSSYTETNVEIPADENGNFVYQYVLDNVYRPLYTVIASTLAGDEVARTTFTDAPASTDLEQCRNGSASSPNDCVALGGGSGWVTGNVGASQGHLTEGLSIPYRAVMTNLPIGTPITITFGYDIKHSDKHAIDYLTHYNRLLPHTIFAHPAETIDPTSGVAGISGTTTTFPIPAPDSTGSPVSGQPTASFNTLPSSERTMTLFGGTITGMAYVSQGDLTASNSETRISITFTASSQTAVLAWGGHIADRDDWGFVGGIPRSAGGISGSPYHMRTIDWTLNNLGNQDRSLSAGTIISPSTITIHKVTEPNNFDPTVFTFNTTGTGYNGFALSGGGQDSQSVNPGSYSVAEVAQSGWNLTGITCTTGGGATANTSGATVNISVPSSGGGTVDCTYTNTLQTGHIVVDKVAVGGDDTFNFNASGGSYADFSLTNAQTPDNQELVAGAYSVSEMTLPGWNSDGGVCASSLGDAETPGTLELDPGETITCTFTNTKQGKIIIEKQTNPDQSPQNFEFDPSYGTNFFLTDGNTNDSGFLTPGTYSAAEVNMPTGWTETGATCSDGSPVTAIALDAGETVTCTFTNTQNGTVIVKKVMVGGTDTFSFTGTPNGTISANNGTISASVAPGAHTSAEGAVSSWDLTGIVCDDGDSAGAGTTATFNVSPGETVTCTFTNTKKPTLTVNKILVPANDSGLFNLQIDGSTSGTGGNVGNGGTTGVQFVTIGAHTVGETAGTATILADYTAVVGGDCAADGSVTLAAGENKVCTITNTRNQGKIELQKDFVGTPENVTINIGTSQGGTQVDSGVLSGDGTLGEHTVNTGAYFVSEILTTPANYTSSLSCFDDANNDGLIVGDAVHTVNINTGEVTIGNNDDVICVFANTRNTGKVIVKKVMLGGIDTFDYTGTPSGSISTDGGTIEVTVDTGAYSSTEGTKTGWDLTSVVCDDVNSTGNAGTRTASFNVEKDEAVTCTFTNTKRGHIIIKKNAIPDGSQEFVFHNDFSNENDPTFTLVDDSTAGLPSKDSEVLPGTYSVTEDTVLGWQQQSATCDSGETIDSIDVAPGETVTCTFTNQKLAKIILVKNTVGGDDTFTFGMTGTGLPSADAITTNGNTGTNTYENLDPDNTYSISETPIPDGWAKTGASCDNGDTVTAITPNSGEVITCTFTNNKPVAQIDLTPLTATNKIGDNHVVTANVQTQNGDGVWGPATDGTIITFSLVNSNGATASFVGGTTCTTTAGSCSVTINSPTAGSVAIHAAASPVVLGLTLPIATGTGGNNSADAAKTYINAQIVITSDSTNEVGDDHTFTVTVKKDLGDGAGLVAASDETVVGSIVGTGSISGGTCLTTDVLGQCTIIVSSATSGTGTIHATVTLSLGTPSVNITRATGDGLSGDSNDTHKTWVDAKISIGQNGVNEIGNPHTFTGHVDVNPGTGFVNAPIGTVINFTIASGPGTLSASNCTTTDASGSCSITLTSATVGTTAVSASVEDINVGGVLLDRTTNGAAGNSDPAVKKWVDAYITIGESETNNITEPHTFTIAVTQVPGSATPATTANITPSVTPTPDSISDTCGTVPFAGMTATCTITINNNTPGVFTADASVALTIDGVTLNRSTDGTAPNSGSAIKTYVAGALEITKAVELGSVVNSASLTKDFTVTVTGPSYLGGHNIIFHLENGVVTPASVILDPIIPGDYAITEVDAGAEWNETIPAGETTVVADETAQATVTNTYVPGSLEVTKTLVLGGYTLPVNGSFSVVVTGPSYPAGTPLTFTVTNGAVSGPETLANLIPGDYTVTETDPGIAWTASGNGNVTVISGETVSPTITNTLKLPHTTISITPNTQETLPGENVILTISDTNDGEVPLADNTVTLTYGSTVIVLDKNSANFSGDTDSDGIMDPGETWTWTYEVLIDANTTFNVDGDGTDLLGNHISPATRYATERGSTLVKVIGTTRTIGFWQTHTDFTNSVFNLLGMQKFVGVNTWPTAISHKGIITATSTAGANQLLGGFYAPIAKTSTGGKRNPSDQARIVLLQQLLAAKLNCAAFGCSVATQSLIAQADTDYAAGNKGAMAADTSLLDAFNNSGDANAIPSTLPATGKATPSSSKALANLAFWDTP